MSRSAQIQFVSYFAHTYDPVVRLLGFPPLWRAIADVAAPAVGEPVLDVCTGTGGAALELARRGARVIGLDLAEGMLRRAYDKHNGFATSGGALFARMDARRLAFPDRSFSLVTCSMALHEMAESEREQVLREISRIASDRVVIAEYRVPQSVAGSLLFRLERAFEYLESDDFERFVRADLRAQLECVGFNVDRPRDVGAYRIWPCRLPAA
jgi:ubiquinone/menaquinone biosynthesis C-methylase UbiE